MSPSHAAVLFAVAFVAGVINSIAGGGTLLSFPALVWAGLDPIVANATNTVSLWPGSLAALLGFAGHLDGAGPWVVVLSVPSIVGGALGAWLLLRTPSPLFASIVPFLILFATALFALQGPITRRLRPARRAAERVPAMRAGRTRRIAVLFQLGIAVYGGYFGAGIGILMLSALALLGFADIHQMIALRNLLAIWINGVAAVYFVASGTVDWPYALLMTAGQVAGGFAGARLAHRLGRRFARRFIVAVGIGMGVALLLRA